MGQGDGIFQEASGVRSPSGVPAIAGFIATAGFWVADNSLAG